MNQTTTSESTKSAIGKRSTWHTLTEEQLARPGGQLLAALFQAANQKGHNLSEMSEQLDCTYGYIAQLKADIRHVKNVSDAFCHAAAQYLGVMPVVVKILAGKLSLSDFLLPDTEADKRIDTALGAISADPLLGGLMPASVHNLSRDEKVFIIMCYQQATGNDVLPTNQLPDILRDLLGSVTVMANHTMGPISLTIN